MQQNRLDRESPQKDKNTVLHKCNLCLVTFAANHGRTVAAPSLGIWGGGHLIDKPYIGSSEKQKFIKVDRLENTTQLNVCEYKLLYFNFFNKLAFFSN